VLGDRSLRRLILGDERPVADIGGCDSHGRGTSNGGDGLQQARTDYPSDQQQWADGVERGLPQLTGDERIGDIGRQGDDAGEDQEATSVPDLVRCRAVQREVPGAKQETEDGHVHGWRHKRRDPGWNAQSQRKGQTLPKPKMKVRATTTPARIVTLRSVISSVDGAAPVWVVRAGLTGSHLRKRDGSRPA
jgi:hypothetical protein